MTQQGKKTIDQYSPGHFKTWFQISECTLEAVSLPSESSQEKAQTVTDRLLQIQSADCPFEQKKKKAGLIQKKAPACSIFPWKGKKERERSKATQMCPQASFLSHLGEQCQQGPLLCPAGEEEQLGLRSTHPTQPCRVPSWFTSLVTD